VGKNHSILLSKHEKRHLEG